MNRPGRRALDGFVGFRARKLHGLIQNHFAGWFAGAGVSPVQAGAMLLIADNPGLQQAELAALLGVEAPTLSQTLARLVARGFVTRARAASDGRAVALTLTAEGAALADRVRAEAPAHEADALSALSAEERTELLRLIDKALSGSGPGPAANLAAE